jgi:integrase
VEYFKELQRKSSIAYYKRQIFQLRRFLKFLKVDWADEITLPSDPYYTPIHISDMTITETFDYFKTNDNYLRIKAVILLGCSSGLRAEEIYNLTIDNIDLDNRKIIVKHEPASNQTTKTKKTRISFITEQAKKAIQEYIEFYNYGNNGLRTLFAKKTLELNFRLMLIFQSIQRFSSYE